jgi:hypothetical protein
LERRLEKISEAFHPLKVNPAETRQRLHSQLNQERGCISSSESTFEGGRGLVAWIDDSRQHPKLEMFVLDCRALAESRNRLHYILESNPQVGRGLVASRQYTKLGMFVLDSLATGETRQRLHRLLNQERGCITSSGSKFEEGRSLVATTRDNIRSSGCLY